MLLCYNAWLEQWFPSLCSSLRSEPSYIYSTKPGRRGHGERQPPSPLQPPPSPSAESHSLPPDTCGPESKPNLRKCASAKIAGTWDASHSLQCLHQYIKALIKKLAKQGTSRSDNQNAPPRLSLTPSPTFLIRTGCMLSAGSHSGCPPALPPAAVPSHPPPPPPSSSPVSSSPPPPNPPALLLEPPCCARSPAVPGRR